MAVHTNCLFNVDECTGRELSPTGCIGKRGSKA
jgi:hypothetical protein